MRVDERHFADDFTRATHGDRMIAKFAYRNVKDPFDNKIHRIYRFSFFKEYSTCGNTFICSGLPDFVGLFVIQVGK